MDAPHAQHTPPPRIPGIEGLRALAAGGVLVYHVWRFGEPDGGRADLGLASVAMPQLWHGVTLFFVISGFLLYRPFAAAILRGTRRPGLARYARSRALRILPAYWVVLLVTAFVLKSSLGPTASGARAPGAAEPGVLGLNLLLLQNYSPGTIFTGIGPAWSLGVEIVFYAALPLLALGALALASSRTGPRRAALAPAAALLAVGASGAVALETIAIWDLGVGRSIWGLAPLFAVGMVVAVVSVEVQDGRLALPRRWRPWAAGLAVAAAGLALAMGMSNVDPPSLTTSLHTLAAGVACALVLALVVLPGRERPGLMVRALSARGRRVVGLASFSVFLWHEPLLHWLRERGATAPGADGFVWNLALVVLVTGVASALTYRLVERPALRLRHRARTPSSRMPAAPASPARALTTAVGQRRPQVVP